jgi:hypothetical protein
MSLRIPVVSIEGKPLMPTTPARARKLITGKVARGRFNKLGIFYLHMSVTGGQHTQPLSMAIDTGSHYEGYAVGSNREVCLKGMSKLPAHVSQKMNDRRSLRRSRRQQLWRRKCRFDNRRKKDYWIAPSQNAKAELREKIVTELARMYPIMQNGTEDIAFNHFTYRHGSYFSTAEIGKTRFYKALEAIAPTIKFKGWQTAQLRKQYGISKSTKKDEISPESHANDAVALLCGMFGHLVDHQNAPFYYWQRPEFARRPLHRQQHQKGHLRPKFGGTKNGGHFRKGDYVEAEKEGKTYRGWVCGLPTQKTNKIGVMDAFGKRIGQFTPRTVRLLCRSTGIM